MLRASQELLWCASLLAQADGLCAHLPAPNPHAGGWLVVAQSQLVQIQGASFCRLARVCFYGALFVDEKQFGSSRVRVCTWVFTPLIFIMWTSPWESTCALGFWPLRSHLFVRVRVTAAHARQRLGGKPEPPCVMHARVACCAWRQARVFRVLSCARLLLVAADP